MQSLSLTPEKENKVASYVGFALRSGGAVLGTDNIRAAKGIKLIIIDSALSRNSAKRVEAYAEREGITAVCVGKMAEISKKEGVKSFGIKNKENEKTKMNKIWLLYTPDTADEKRRR